jgi:hypothetical protein
VAAFRLAGRLSGVCVALLLHGRLGGLAAALLVLNLDVGLLVQPIALLLGDGAALVHLVGLRLHRLGFVLHWRVSFGSSFGSGRQSTIAA